MYLTKARTYLIIGALLVSVLLITGCTPTQAPPVVEKVVETVIVTVVVEPTPMPTDLPPPPPDQSVQIAEWESGPHGRPYDPGKGPNTMCSRCHSPQNWIPGSKVGEAPNCVTCKFPHEKEWRIAPTFAEGGMDLVTEEQWVGIPCEQCHRVDENGTASANLSWLSPVSLVYEDIVSPNDLCAKCHTAPGGSKWSSQGRGGDLNHEIYLGGSAHLKYAGEWPQADRPQYCIDCHNAHTGQAKQCVDCHTDTVEKHASVAPMMTGNVTCMACHDASRSEVGRATEDGPFTTIKTFKTPGTNNFFIAESVSHSIKYKVSCDRCHFEGNSHELQVLNADGSPVEAEEEG